MSTYSKLIKKFSDQNPEKFNKDFILSKNDDEILPEITNIFKSLEVIKEIHVESITQDRHEENFGPIKKGGKYYKSPLESRLTKIHYKVRIDGLNKTIEKDMFLPKMLDNCFYINESVRFFPTWQVVDNLSYSTDNGVALKSLMLPITLIKNEPFNCVSEFTNTVVSKVPCYTTLCFRKKISPLYYIMLDFSMKSLEKSGISPFENLEAYQTYKDETLIDSFNKYLNLDIKFDDDPSKLVEDGRTVFKIATDKQSGVSFSIKTTDIDTIQGKVCLSLLLGTSMKERKSKLVLSKDEFITPWFWLNTMIDVSGYSKSSEPFKRIDKINGVYTSLNRIIDDKVRSTLTIAPEYKTDVFATIKYLLYHFDERFNADPQDLHNKRIRLYEYILYPLRVYFGDHINRIVNQPNRDPLSIEKIFTSLTPMFLIQNLITSQLLRTYNSANDFNLFSAYLKGTFKGPQALNKGVSFEQRDIHESYVGRIGLVAASPGDPGVSFTFSPFVHIYDGYFDKSESKKAKE